MKSRRWNAAHRCVVKNVAPDAIADDDHEFLHVLLNELAAVSSEIEGWELSGGVFLDFIEVEAEVRELLQRRMDVPYRMERLRPKVGLKLISGLEAQYQLCTILQVSSLCSRVASLEVDTAKERLCQSEIAKKVNFNLHFILWRFHSPSPFLIF